MPRLTSLQILIYGLSFGITAFAPPAAFSQEYPTRPIRWLVGAAPGGGNDLLARMVGEKLSLAFGKRVVIDNRVGASSLIAMELAKKAQPDGYTLLSVSATATSNQALRRNQSIDVLKDYEAIARMTSQPNILLVPAASPVRSVSNLIAAAKARPGGINYGSSGVGTSLHLSAELFSFMAKVNIKHVPYKGGGTMLVDLVSGQIDLAFGLLASARPHVEAGRLYPVAVTGRNRIATLPNVPTMDESGLPGYEVVGWYGVVAPAGTPKLIVNLLSANIIKVMQLPDVRKSIQQQAAEVSTATPDEFAKDMRDEVVKWSKLLKHIELSVAQ